MTIYEASARYQIPLDILRDYERWGLCGAVKKVMGAWQYDDRDLELLSLIMTLHDIGFSTEEIETYMRLCWREPIPIRHGCRCSTESATPPWMRSIFVKNSWSGWTIFGMRSGPGKPGPAKAVLYTPQKGGLPHEIADPLLFPFRQHRRLAELIALETGGALLEILPKTAYPQDYTTVVNQARRSCRPASARP